MKIKNPKIKKTISLENNITIDVEISDILAEKIKQEYKVKEIKDHHIQGFFANVLQDVSSNSDEG